MAALIDPSALPRSANCGNLLSDNRPACGRLLFSDWRQFFGKDPDVHDDPKPFVTLVLLTTVLLALLVQLRDARLNTEPTFEQLRVAQL